MLLEESNDMTAEHGAVSQTERVFQTYVAVPRSVLSRLWAESENGQPSLATRMELTTALADADKYNLKLAPPDEGYLSLPRAAIDAFVANPSGGQRWLFRDSVTAALQQVFGLPRAQAAAMSGQWFR